MSIKGFLCGKKLIVDYNKDFMPDVIVCHEKIRNLSPSTANYAMHDGAESIENLLKNSGFIEEWVKKF